MYNTKHPPSGGCFIKISIAMQTIIFNHKNIIQELNDLATYCNLTVDFKYFNSKEFKAECEASQPMVDRIMNLLQQIDDAWCNWGDQYFDLEALDALGDGQLAEDRAEHMYEELIPMENALDILSNRMELPIGITDAHEEYLCQLADYEHPSLKA
jgi:hypothetical protein